MLMDIQSIQLLLIRDAETENFINDLEYDKHGHAGPEENEPTPVSCNSS